MSDDPAAPPRSRADVEAPPTPHVATLVFGDRTALAEQLVRMLADTGVGHGLLGPREAPRLWDRHVLNCAVVQSAFPEATRVADVGTGAGLPGLVLAVARPDLHLELIEPLQRRTRWLRRAIAELGLDNVTIREGRAEAYWGELQVPFVTARAVARIGELARWCLPLLTTGGVLLALKGASAAQELEEDAAELTACGALACSLETYGYGVVDPVTTVLRVVAGQGAGQRDRAPGRAGTPRRTRRAGAPSGAKLPRPRRLSGPGNGAGL